MTIADEYVSAATQALGGREGDAALDALGWWQLLGDLSEPNSRTAAFAFFRAQGRTQRGDRSTGT